MISSRFCFPQLSNHYWWLTFQRLLRIGIIVGAFSPHAHGLECYDCIHVSAPSLPPGTISGVAPGKENPDCIDPMKSNSITKKACADPNESCMKGYAGGTVPGYGIKVEILVRQCFLHSTGQSMPETCTDYTGIAYGSNFTINWGAAARSLPQVFTETMQNLHKAVAADSKAKQLQLPDLDVTGTYCLCKAKDLCNDASGMQVGNTGGGGGGGNTNTTTTPIDSNSNGSTTPSTLADPSADRSPIHKAQPQQLIFFLMASIIILPSLFLSLI